VHFFYHITDEVGTGTSYQYNAILDNLSSPWLISSTGATTPNSYCWYGENAEAFSNVQLLSCHRLHWCTLYQPPVK